MKRTCNALRGLLDQFALGSFGKIESGTKYRTGTSQNHNTSFPPLRQLVQSFDEQAHHRDRKCISTLWAIECQYDNTFEG
jgi:hypothetical protein